MPTLRNAVREILGEDTDQGPSFQDSQPTCPNAGASAHTRRAYRGDPLFRASINGRGGPLSCDAAHHRWQSYCTAAHVGIDIHQLRHAHATELINAGVSIEAVRRRLGHASTETTQLYALLDDKVADAEIRAARRRRDQATS
ncbi:tyrosine-type recombinase/integrase [Microtetraspora malaysiensis]|uniref:tyrosine-type recombinase/integrase n=1 Tax=Microtetraspora malaysiensis TaxID=161358 RepID=UPI003D8A479C